MPTKMHSLKNLVFSAMAIGIAIILFAIDVNSGTSKSFSPLYTLVVLFSWLTSFWYSFFTTLFCGVLILLTSYYQIQSGQAVEDVMINTFVGMSAVGVTYLLTRVAGNSAAELRRNNELLNDMVMERTQELTRKVKELTEHKQLIEENKAILDELQVEIQKSEQKYQLMIDKVNDYSIVFLNPQGKIQTWNNGAKKLRGYGSSETLGNYFYEFVLPENEERHLEGQEIIEKTIERGSYSHEGFKNIKDGSYMYANDHLSAIRAENGELMGFTWVTRNLTKQKQKEDEIANLNRELETKVQKRTKDLESFAYSVSHDLRAPLRAINGFSEILLTEFSAQIESPEVTRYIEIIANNSRKMSSLIDDLLTFSRLGKKSFERTRINLNELIEYLHQDLILNFPEFKNAEFKFHIDVKIVMGDRLLLQQALANLLSNAFKYSSKQDQQIVQFTATETPNEIILCMSDNGAGFDMKYSHKLFKVFQRLHDGNDFEGTGIGLAIVKQVAEHHQGRVWAESELNKGAKFFMTIKK